MILNCGIHDAEGSQNTRLLQGSNCRWDVSVILEVAPLRIRAGHAEAFEQSFLKAQQIIRGMPGYISHEIQRCVENPNEYVLLVRWESIEAHEWVFRRSPQYEEWKSLLHHFYDPFPTVLHYEAVHGAASA